MNAGVSRRNSAASQTETANDLRSELAREKMWSRIYLIPALTAESDRDLVRRHYADQAREKELMGSNTKVYNTDKYVDLPRRLKRARAKYVAV
jgi:hypothetical protein